VCPILGEAGSKMQPINKVDLAEITKELIQNWQNNKIIDASGSRTATTVEIIEMIKKAISIRCIRLRIPVFALRLVHFLLPFDVEGLICDKICDKNTAYGKSNLELDINEIVNLGIKKKGNIGN